MRSYLWLLSCVCVVSVLPFHVAGAEAPCKADIARLCKDVPIGGGRIQACLKKHEAQVSEACGKTVDALASEVKTAALVCRWDIALLCSDVSPGGGRLLACLEKNSVGLSPECAQQLRDLKKGP